MLLLLILRGTFVLIVAAIAFLYAEQIPALAERRVAAILFAVMGAFLIVVVDMVWPRKSLRALAGVLFGLLAGMFVAYVFSLTVNFLASVFIARPESMKVMELVEQTQQALSRESPDVLAAKSLLMQAVRASRAPSFLLQFIKFMVGAVSCYLTISFVMQTKDDFRFVVPYVEFSRQTKGGRSFLLDTSVIIDGRIADVCKTGVIESEIIIPRFVLQELQGIADSSDRLKRKRGRRGLDILNAMQADESIDLVIRELSLGSTGTVDERLVEAAKATEGRLVTTDYNLNKIARLRGVEVININDMANALKPVFLPGEGLRLKIVKPGEEPGQGVGYLDDGTMVVIEQGKDRIGKTVDVLVTSALQTSAGRLIFGKLSEGGNEGNSHRHN